MCYQCYGLIREPRPRKWYESKEHYDRYVATLRDPNAFRTVTDHFVLWEKEMQP